MAAGSAVLRHSGAGSAHRQLLDFCGQSRGEREKIPGITRRGGLHGSHTEGKRPLPLPGRVSLGFSPLASFQPPVQPETHHLVAQSSGSAVNPHTVATETGSRRPNHGGIPHANPAPSKRHTDFRMESPLSWLSRTRQYSAWKQSRSWRCRVRNHRRQQCRWRAENSGAAGQHSCRIHGYKHAGDADGLRLARAVRGRWPPIHLILTSGLMSPNEDEFPADGRFIRKPCQAARLIATLRELLKQNRSPDPDRYMGKAA